MAYQMVLTCGTFATDAQGVTSCAQQDWVKTYVIPPEEQAQIDLLIKGGFDQDTFELFFGGTLLMFAIGFGVGLTISQIRKLKI